MKLTWNTQQEKERRRKHKKFKKDLRKANVQKGLKKAKKRTKSNLKKISGKKYLSAIGMRQFKF